ncbi:MAG: hypothetical protein ABI723_22865 [Bacteroidia bacterium]
MKRIKKIRSLLIAIMCVCTQLYAQDKPESCHCPGMAPVGKGTFYFTFGYNLDWFTKSDIHFKSNGSGDFDFTIYNVKAEDRPGLKNMLHEDLTIPQYSYRFGYWLNNKKDLGFEISYDHVKYVMIQNQIVHLKGMINEKYYDQDTMLVPEFLQYEHTNGANYFMIEGIKRLNFYHAKNEKHWVSAIFKAGGGIVVPRSDTNVMGQHRNDTYHVAGVVFGGEAGLRYDFLKHFHLETTLKPCYANYFNVFLYGNGTASQHWFSMEYIFTLGFQFPAKIF